MGSSGVHFECDKGAIPSHAVTAMTTRLEVAGSTLFGPVVFREQRPPAGGDYRQRERAERSARGPVLVLLVEDSDDDAFLIGENLRLRRRVA
jgi:hypothetical protein